MGIRMMMVIAMEIGTNKKAQQAMTITITIGTEAPDHAHISSA